MAFHVYTKDALTKGYSMMTTPNQSSALHSELLRDDPEMHDLVAEFVYGLDQRIEEIRQAFQKNDWETLGTLTHRIKGAGGSYGYPSLSALGASMEAGAKSKQSDPFGRWMTELAALVAAAKAGLS